MDSEDGWESESRARSMDVQNLPVSQIWVRITLESTSTFFAELVRMVVTSCSLLNSLCTKR